MCVYLGVKPMHSLGTGKRLKKTENPQLHTRRLRVRHEELYSVCAVAKPVHRTSKTRKVRGR
jgi:hypothetical protein